MLKRTKQCSKCTKDKNIFLLKPWPQFGMALLKPYRKNQLQFSFPALTLSQNLCLDHTFNERRRKNIVELHPRKGVARNQIKMKRRRHTEITDLNCF
jgi:hypothetical protein